MFDRDKPKAYRIPRRIEWSYACIRFLFGPLVRLIWIKRVEGADHIPRRGPALLAATHESYFDFICTIAVARRNVYYLAAEKFFRNPLWRPIMRATGQIEVDREHKEKRAHIDQIVRDLLNAGEAVGIFPEGTRAPSPHELLRGYPGVIRYAFETGAPIVPIGIRGAFSVMSRFDKKPRFRRNIELSIGEPIRYGLSTVGPVPADERINGELSALMKKLAILSGKAYPYAES